jgi:xanthine dehydrogenase small subunit
MSVRVRFSCNGAPVDTEVAAGETLLSVLRERLHLTSVKDGCAPQGQCGCCTVLVDGDARVACVTPATRVEGRAVTTVEGLEPQTRDRLAEAFVATGGSQCGFCTPGIVMRGAAAIGKGRTSRPELDRALAAHLCRCTGWITVYEAIARAATPELRTSSRASDAATRARLEGGVAQQVGPNVPLGGGGFADDTTPPHALVAVPASAAGGIEAAGVSWVVADTLHEARIQAGKIQGRRTPVGDRPPLPLPERPTGGVRLATGWVEPAYLEPDASWCEPGGQPASPLANGGAFGGKQTSVAPAAARELAHRLKQTVRVVLSREDVVRLGPKRPPMAAAAVCDRDRIRIVGIVAGDPGSFEARVEWPYRVAVEHEWRAVSIPGPPTASHLRAVGVAERMVLLEGALTEAGADRAELVTDDRAAGVLLDACAPAVGGAIAGAAVDVDGVTGAINKVSVRVAAGDPLDEIVLRSYCIGAAHMALGWVLTEGIAVDADGEVHDLTIRSFGVIRAKDTPPITVHIADDGGAPRPRASDAVFAAVAAAAWNAVAAAESVRPDTFPARGTRAAQQLRK